MSGEPDPRQEVREGLRYCLMVFLGIRVALAVIALVGVALLPDFSHVPEEVRRQLPIVPTPVSVPGWPAASLTHGWHNLFTAWERLDALWFLKIAAHGYSANDASAAFFPLYPMLVRGLSFLIGGHPFAAALLISNGAFAAALMVLYLLTRRELSEELARRAVLYAAVFPTSFFFLAPYSESLFLLLVLLSFSGARRGRWGVAGVSGALAALTRNVGGLMVLPLAIEAIHQAVERRRAGPEGERRPFRLQAGPLFWSFVPALGTLLYLWSWGTFSGDWLAPLHAQANWQRHLGNPLVTLGKGTQEAFRWIGLYAGGYHLLDWIITVAVLAAGVTAAIKFRPAYGAFVWATILIPLSSIFPPRPLIAFSRYALPIFPIYWAMARWTAGSRARHEILVAASAALLGLMTLLFVNWYYVI
jgi:hypothetical protein